MLYSMCINPTPHSWDVIYALRDSRAFGLKTSIYVKCVFDMDKGILMVVYKK